MTVSMAHSTTQPLSAPQTRATPDPVILEALRRVVESQIGPRRPGAIYQNVRGRFEVLAVVRDPGRARALLGRRCSQWAVIVRDVLRPNGEPFAVGSPWSTEDYLVRAADDACVLCGYWRCRCGEAHAPSGTVNAMVPGSSWGADQRCVCGRSDDQCRCPDPYPRTRVHAGVVAVAAR
ncbi:hypothetical protein [Streptomyces cucumeris]|uniref:hypothetical protein n=1 Tax=Streptomyces cucumeris TaxID=2962890 RepID=UPI0020C90AB3|nr:hypothetical protein [Streptomyces sp. NEAU-Y11]MCP9213295.1 hypothetical protein [Streptomyces sp. NEAU-Y11]